MLWFRLYDDVLTSRKVMTLSDGAFRLWVLLLAVAKRANDDGGLPAIGEIAWMLRLDEGVVREGLSTLIKGGLVDVEGGVITPFSRGGQKGGPTPPLKGGSEGGPDPLDLPLRMHDWEDWQYATDGKTSAQRTRKYREKMRQLDGDDEGASHGADDGCHSVTGLRVTPERHGDKLRDALEQSREEKNRAETEQSRARVTRGSARKPEVPYTEGMLQADEFREWAKQRLLGCNVDAELLSFEAHAMANDRRLRDWQAGFRQWLLKARADARPPTRGASTPSAAPPTREQAEWFVRQWIKGAHGQEVAATWVGPGYAPSDERAWPIVSDAYSRLKADWTEGRRW